jgi:8-oxo-dGTP diphosphatase
MSNSESIESPADAAAAAEKGDLFRTTGRHAVVPRTLCFVFSGDLVLLLRGGPTKWFAGRMNGVGGHVEPGESVMAAARREISEETGLHVVDLKLRAVMHCQGGTGAVMMFVFSATSDSRDIRQSGEGTLEWTPLDRIAEFPVLDDVRPLIERISSTRTVSFGAIECAADGRLQKIEFEESCVNAPI